MTDRIDFITPVGRWVQGSLTTPNTTTVTGEPLTVKKPGANFGQPREEFWVKIAILKTDPGWPAFYALAVQAAREKHSHLVAENGACSDPNYSWKITDGDSTIPNRSGVRPCDREGFPGCWIVKLSTGLGAPRLYSRLPDPNGPVREVLASQAKTGDYIRVIGSVANNHPSQTPGIFINLGDVELIAYGEAIATRPDGAAMFGAAPAATVPTGGSLVPTAPVAAAPALAPAAPAPVSAPALAPAAPVQPAPVQPAHDFLNAPAAPIVVRRQDVAGNVWTESDLVNAGFTPEQIAALPVVNA